MELIRWLAEEGLRWLVLFVELVGIAIIALGAIRGVAAFVVRRLTESGNRFARSRQLLARHLSLALEFQLAADILETSMSPGWTRIGQLAAVAAIRTGLNFALAHEIKGDEGAEETRSQRV